MRRSDPVATEVESYRVFGSKRYSEGSGQDRTVMEVVKRSESAAWMEFLVHDFQTFAVDVCVNLRRRD